MVQGDIPRCQHGIPHQQGCIYCVSWPPTVSGQTFKQPAIQQNPPQYQPQQVVPQYNVMTQSQPFIQPAPQQIFPQYQPQQVVPQYNVMTQSQLPFTQPAPQQNFPHQPQQVEPQYQPPQVMPQYNVMTQSQFPSTQPAPQQSFPQYQPPQVVPQYNVMTQSQLSYTQPAPQQSVPQYQPQQVEPQYNLMPQSQSPFMQPAPQQSFPQYQPPQVEPQHNVMTQSQFPSSHAQRCQTQQVVPPPPVIAHQQQQPRLLYTGYYETEEQMAASKAIAEALSRRLPTFDAPTQQVSSQPHLANTTPALTNLQAGVPTSQVSLSQARGEASKSWNSLPTPSTVASAATGELPDIVTHFPPLPKPASKAPQPAGGLSNFVSPLPSLPMPPSITSDHFPVIAHRRVEALHADPPQGAEPTRMLPASRAPQPAGTSSNLVSPLPPLPTPSFIASDPIPVTAHEQVEAQPANPLQGGVPTQLLPASKAPQPRGNLSNLVNSAPVCPTALPAAQEPSDTSIRRRVDVQTESPSQDELSAQTDARYPSQQKQHKVNNSTRYQLRPKIWDGLMCGENSCAEPHYRGQCKKTESETHWEVLLPLRSDPAPESHCTLCVMKGRKDQASTHTYEEHGRGRYYDHPDNPRLPSGLTRFYNPAPGISEYETRPDIPPVTVLLERRKANNHGLIDKWIDAYTLVLARISKHQAHMADSSSSKNCHEGDQISDKTWRSLPDPEWSVNADSLPSEDYRAAIVSVLTVADRARYDDLLMRYGEQFPVMGDDAYNVLMKKQQRLQISEEMMTLLKANEQEAKHLDAATSRPVAS